MSTHTELPPNTSEPPKRASQELAEPAEPVGSMGPLSSSGLTLQVDFAWSKFRNVVASKGVDQQLTPLYVQHFRPAKPQLRFERASDQTIIAKGTIHSFSISGDCIIHGQEVILKPLKRWKTKYNYLSHALGGIPITWTANSTMKVWDFVCINSATQESIAKFSVNLWAMKQVGNFYFEETEEEVTEALRDEVVVTGLTLLYLMMTRMNNPIHLLGAAFAKPGKVEGDGNEGAVAQENEPSTGKAKII
ncbi:uncharacterized protein J4E88_010357 [Alternaria novae-zelandiae]|uniref:uncharacterized protein n=1 Tax=Alternaria novae-zelandiae TaxID=430562 RepID=UPI0020C3C9BB|nr:uncharacterized protein J4E88_010357 [Alternaria novae-zelandiae]XP_051348724.1 uncharacterized protein J4E92_009650 [Alternaria infectoria]KAI4666936.1 hypothetical protein J4E88_010357 [Alternaria novae-zelandiae]KAI4914236.1 hypothetical protein J4E92_009650 [Alternaria infectoria]